MPAGTPGKPKLRVLVVDDNRDQVSTTQTLLGLEKFETKGVHSGLAALTEIDKFKPDVVLLDIGMPDLKGDDVASAIREAGRRDLLLIAITGRSRLLPAEVKAFDYWLEKPCNPNELVMLLTNYAERHSADA
jgi:CheY-like chemotaxis protein